MRHDWLVARPIAHRGFHDSAEGRIENTLSAVSAAIVGRFAVEVDLQLSADGEAMVFHDATLDRLTAASGPLAARSAAELTKIPFRGSDDRMARFGDLLDHVAGATPLVVELKSRWRREADRALVRRAADVARSYRGALALMSFDPGIVAGIAAQAPRVPRGIVAEACRDDAYWGHLTALERFSLRHIVHAPRSRPSFVAYGVRDLPAPATRLARRLGLPVLSWTVRTPADAALARRFADQIIFEGFDPDAVEVDVPPEGLAAARPGPT